MPLVHHFSWHTFLIFLKQSVICRTQGIGNHKVEGLEVALVGLVERVGQGVGLHHQRGGVVVQDHVHPCQACGGRVLFLAVKGDAGTRLVAYLEQK